MFPLQFRRNLDSRFQFAQSASSMSEALPQTATIHFNEMLDDLDEIEVPKKI